MTDWPRCATCRWWEPKGQEAYRPHAWPFGAKVGECLRLDYYDGPDQSLARAQGEGSDQAWVLTKPDFGCVMHEPKEQQG